MDEQTKIGGETGEMFEPPQTDGKHEPKPFKLLLPRVFERIATYETAGGVTGVPTGFAKLDEITCDFQNGDLIIVGGCPSMGKTSLCLSMAMRAAVKAGRPTAIFSLEMPEDKIAERILCAEARVNMYALRRGMLPKRDSQGLSFAAGKLAGAPLFIDSTPGITEIELLEKAKRLKSQSGLALIIIDYLQLIHRSSAGAAIFRSLKCMAMELDVPVIGAYGFSSGMEQRIDRRPRLSDLPESHAVERDADVVMFVYRGEAYDNDGKADRGIAEIIVAKHRNGPVGTVIAAFSGGCGKFEDIDS